MKLAGKPGTGEPYAGFDEAGAGNGPIPSTAPVLDPTCEGLGMKLPRATRLITLLSYRSISVPVLI
jgi:hypothetical protein